jgi:hypothetical protein
MQNRKKKQELMENNLLEYSLISVLIILFHTVLPGSYLIKNIPITNRKELSLAVEN